jgi:hypothetical protein
MRALRALLVDSVFYIQGPNTRAAAAQRTLGMESQKPTSVWDRAKIKKF